MNIPVDLLKAELAAASPDLPDNADLLRGVLSGCGDCIKILDLDGRLQFMSDGGKRVMEVDDFATLKGCPWPDFWPGTGNQDATRAVATARAGGTGRFRGPANTAKGNPRYWDVQVSPIYNGGKVAQILSISRDITEEWEAREREQFLMEELVHRSKNSFAMVLAVANQTFRGGTHAQQLASFTSRIIALSKAYEMAKQSNFADQPVAEVVEGALTSHRERIAVSGPDIKLNPKEALALALAVNELTTNAAKYGALSGNGRVEITWSRNEKFHFLWREMGGPHVTPPERKGFGTRVIKDFLALDFGGVVNLSYEPTGFVCELSA